MMSIFRAAVIGIVALAAGLVSASAQTAAGDVEIQSDVEYANHDGVVLQGDLYQPKAPGKYPAIVAVHGGGLGARVAWLPVRDRVVGWEAGGWVDADRDGELAVRECAAAGLEAGG